MQVRERLKLSMVCRSKNFEPDNNNNEILIFLVAQYKGVRKCRVRKN